MAYEYRFFLLTKSYADSTGEASWLFVDAEWLVKKQGENIEVYSFNVALEWHYFFKMASFL